MQNSLSASCARFPLALRFLHCITTFRFCQELFSTVPKLLAVGIATPPVRSVSLSASCARYGSPCLGYVDSIAHILPKVKHYFRFFRKWFLTFTRWKGLFFAPLLQSALCAPVSARSARVTLVALTVGFMALFHLPGLSPVDFYWQSRVTVCGCVGASRLDRETDGGWRGCPPLPCSVFCILP